MVRARLQTLLLPIALSAVPSGCAPDRCEIPTSDLSMVARVIDNGNSFRAELDFASGERGVDSDSWSTCDGDEVTINGRSATETRRDGRVEYSTTALADSQTRDFTFALSRVGKDSVNASVQVAPPFEITRPQAGAALSRANDTELLWQPGGDTEMRIRLVEEIGKGLCIVSDAAEEDYKSLSGVGVPDVGQWVIPAASLSSESDAPCDARLVLSRFSRGEYPATLKPGGFVEAEVVRGTAFLSEP